MKQLKFLMLPLAITFTAACSGGSDSYTPEMSPVVAARPALELSFTEPPIELPGIAASFAQDVSYGEGERNLFDIYLPDCEGPTALAVYVHGGGFTGGDKSGTHKQNAEHIREFLQACVAYATVNYFLLTVESDAVAGEGASAGRSVGAREVNAASGHEQGGVLASLQDVARALQFMRYHYQSLNIEPENVASYGGSAGAGASLWLGTHDEMGVPDSDDPVLRESTRLKAVGAIATQSTYDLVRWEGILLPVTEPLAGILGGTDIPTVAAFVNSLNYLLTFLGVDSVEAIESEENASYRANVDMLELMDAGDAPVWVSNFETGFDDPLDMFLHHALHAIAVKERADEVGLHSVAYSSDPAFPLEDASGEDLVSFFLRHIN